MRQMMIKFGFDCDHSYDFSTLAATPKLFNRFNNQLVLIKDSCPLCHAGVFNFKKVICPRCGTELNVDIDAVTETILDERIKCQQ